MARRGAWLALAVVLTAAGCDRQPREQTRAPAVAQAPPAFALPNLTTAADAVRAQITDQFAELQALQASGTATPAQIAGKYGDLGKLLLAANYYDAAAGAFLNAQSADAANPQWPYYLGHVYRQGNEPDKAVAAFERARRLQPDDVPTLVWLGEAQLGAGHADAAAAPLAEALERQPQHARATAALGRVALARRDYAGAVTRFEEALRLAPQATALHYQLSLAYQGAGDAARAAEHLKQRGTAGVPMADPLMDGLSALLDSANLYDARSRAALSRGDWTTAMAEARRGLELAGVNAQVRAALHHRLGTALAQTGDRAGAQREFAEAVEASPEFAAGHYSLGILLAGSGRTDAAIREFTAALRYEPSYVPARLARADALRQRGRAAESLADYRQVQSTEQDSPAALYGEALALAGMGQHVEARDKLLEASSRHPSDRSLALALARLLAASSDSRVHDPARALSIAEPIVRAQVTLEGVETMALALAGLGRFDEAASLQGEALAQAQRTGQPALAAAMAETQRQYRRRQIPRALWREEPLYEPTR